MSVCVFSIPPCLPNYIVPIIIICPIHYLHLQLRCLAVHRPNNFAASLSVSWQIKTEVEPFSSSPQSISCCTRLYLRQRVWLKHSAARQFPLAIPSTPPGHSTWLLRPMRREMPGPQLSITTLKLMLYVHVAALHGSCLWCVWQTVYETIITCSETLRIPEYVQSQLSISENHR